jgi:hypothetical protein
MSQTEASDLFHKVAERARELADLETDDLRDILGSDDTRADRRGEMSRGELVEAILLEEFDEDFETLDWRVEPE